MEELDEDQKEFLKNTHSAKRGLTHEEIMSNSIIFLLASFENVANSVMFLLYNLALNVDKQEKLLEEIDAVMDGQKVVTYDMMSKVPYLEMCINESLRLFPPAPRLERICNSPVTINGITIQKGWSVSINIYALSRDPEVFPDPETYVPERFSSDKKADIHPFQHMPFGMGPRNCIGIRLAQIQLKSAAMKFLHEFRVAPCQETEIPVKLKKLQMQPINPLKLKLITRK